MTTGEVREQLIDATILELQSVSRDAFAPAQMCERLGVNPSSVNYHFGSREGMLLEAAVVAYERYGQQFRNLPVRGGEGFEKNLVAHIDHQIAWTRENHTVSGIINAATSTAFSADQQARIDRAFYYNLTILAAAILEVVDKVEHPGVLTEPEIRQRPDIALATAMVAYLVHGRAIWEGGPFVQITASDLVGQASQAAGRAFMPIVLGIVNMCVALARKEGATG